MAAASFCNYEHLGGCSDTLTHYVEYWLGEARKRFGPWAYFCSAHVGHAAHLGVQPLEPHHRNHRRIAKAVVTGGVV